MPVGRTIPRGFAAVAGVLAVAAALGAAQLTALMDAAFRTPVLSVADAVVRYSPPGVTAWAIEIFGTYDKLVLRVGVYVVLAGFAAGIGLLARRRFALGVAATGVLGVVGVLAALDDGGAPVAAVLPTAVAVAVGLAVLALLLKLAPDRSLGESLDGTLDESVDETLDGRLDEGPRREDGAAPPLSRRRFVQAAVAVGALAAGGHALARALETGLQETAQRAAPMLPKVLRRMDLPVPAAAHPDVAGLPPFVSANEDFYRIDTALLVPRIDPAEHEIRVIGMVGKELTIPFRQVLERGTLAVPMNLICVSNEVGGDLVDAAVWQGLLLRDVLDEAGVADEADQIVGRSVDGYTCGFPVALAYDRPTMLVVGMNGETLPARHGFPVRLVTPGIYGYVGSTKWLSEIELTRFDQFTQYWASRGYADRAPVKVSSRIDVPSPSASVSPGTVAVAGTAWAAIEGVAQVEVRVDDGPWQEAELAAPVNTLTWRQWVYRWNAAPGSYRLTVRAADAAGAVQVEEPSGPRPDGVTGYHTIAVTVEEA